MSLDSFGLLKQIITQGEKSTSIWPSRHTKQVNLDKDIRGSGIKLQTKFFVTGICLVLASVQEISDKFKKPDHCCSQNDSRKIVCLISGFS